MRIFKKSVYFLFESGSLDSPGGPSSNRRYSITGVLRRRVIMNFTSKGPAEAKSTITLRRIHLIRRPYAKRRGRRETMFDCPLSKTVKILDQRSCSISDFSVATLAKIPRSIFHSPWRFPCRRGTRVIISTPFIPVHVTFAHRVTTCTGSTDKERRLSRSTRNP